MKQKQLATVQGQSMESKVLVKSHELNLQPSHFIRSSLGNTAAKEHHGHLPLPGFKQFQREHLN